MCDRTPRALLFSLSHLNILTDKIILLKQSSQGNLHPGYFLTWEGPLDASSGISPRYSSATSSKHMSHSVHVPVTRLGLTQRKDRDKTHKVL